MDVSSTNDFLSINDGVDTPGFYRLNSEVIEKPSTLDDGHDNFFVTSSSPSPSHSSLHSGMNDGEESWWLPNWGVLHEGRDVIPPNGDDLLALSLCVAGGVSDSELEAQGDVDEGFDEEFEERDLNESDNSNRQHPAYRIEDLDPKEVQHLLGEDQLLDFDLGVDVLDSEQNQAILPPVSLAHTPVSQATTPDHVLSPSPTPSLDSNSHVMMRNRWNLNNDHLSPASSPVSGSYGGSRDAPVPPQEIVGTQDYSEEQLAMLVSACGAEKTHMSYEQGPLMDLSETIALATSNPLLSSEPANSDLQSILQFANGSGHLPFLSPPTTTDRKSVV